MSDTKLMGKRALVTGATAGLGRRFATVLANAGAEVAVAGRRAELLDDVAETHSRVHPFPCDLNDPLETIDLANRALAAIGPIDILVNNAAFIAGGVRAEDESLEQIQRTLNVNLVAPILLAQAVLPGMRERGTGSIINITSIVASVGIARFPQASYAASKGGLQAITREWAAQWGRHGVRVNAIAPGFFESEMTADVIHRESVHEWILGNTILPRHGTVNDFDAALLLLASDDSSYMTGQTITVDGGWTAR